MRFFFDIEADGNVVPDSEGIEFTTSQDAQHEAVLAAREMMAERLRRGQPMGAQRRFMIRNSMHDLIVELRFCDAIPAE